jgi:hypothetical protein
MNKVILEELENMKYLFGYKPGKVISEQAAPVAPAAAAPVAPATVEDAIKKIQTILNTKYGAKLNVDGKWGNLTQTALEQAMVKAKSVTPKATGEITPPAATVATVTPTERTDTKSPLVNVPTNITAPNVQNLVPATTQPATTQPALPQQSQDALGGKLTPQQIRQQSRFDQRLARQARRNERRAGQQ